MDQTLPPKMGIRGPVPFDDPTFERVAISLGIANNSASRIHNLAPWKDQDPLPAPNFWLVKFEEDTPEYKSIGYTIDKTKVLTCETIWFKAASGVCYHWAIEGYVIRDDDLKELTQRCAARLHYIAGGYDELVEYPAGQDPEEPRLDNETGMGMNVKFKEVFLGPPDRYNPRTSGGRYLGWKRTGELNGQANFWAIKVASWPIWDHDRRNLPIENVYFENNWIFTNVREEAQRWSPRHDDSRMRGVAELQFETRGNLIEFLKKCERKKHWFGDVKVVRNTDEHERGGPIELVAIYSEEFQKHHNRTPVPLEEGDWKPQGTKISLDDLEADFNERVERFRGGQAART